MSASFNTKTGKGNYGLSFETDDKEQFLCMQELARKMVDGLHIKKELKTASPNYEAMYEKLQEEHKKLCAEYAAVKAECKSLESEFARMRAQLDIVYLIFGKR